MRDLRPMLLSIYFPIGACIILMTILAALFYSEHLVPSKRHRRIRERVSVTILRLSVNRPAELTDDQWAYCIVEIWNLHANYGSIPAYVPTTNLERTQLELEQRIDRGPNPKTIDWVF